MWWKHWIFPTHSHPRGSFGGCHPFAAGGGASCTGCWATDARAGGRQSDPTQGLCRRPVDSSGSATWQRISGKKWRFSNDQWIGCGCWILLGSRMSWYLEVLVHLHENELRGWYSYWYPMWSHRNSEAMWGGDSKDCTLACEESVICESVGATSVSIPTFDCALSKGAGQLPKPCLPGGGDVSFLRHLHMKWIAESWKYLEVAVN